ncbi:MAG: site-specific integrase [bacterium]|nr:site-specific integrase [bacterium]
MKNLILISDISPVFDDFESMEIEQVDQTDEDYLISASDDVGAMLEWVNRYKHSPHTFAAARKDAERFYLWIRNCGLTLKTVRKQDCERYRDFLSNPMPTDVWCGPPKPRYNSNGQPNSAWKPFVGRLKRSSVKQTCTQMFGLYEFLSNAGYVSGNPWRLLGRLPKAETQADFIERFLDVNSMQILRSYIDSMRLGNHIEQKHYARTRWIFSLLYLSAARRSEVVSAKMGDFRLINGKWWWKVLGKGETVGDIPVNDELISELANYRSSLGLSPLPSLNETTPLLSDVSGKLRAVCSSSLYKTVKKILDNAADMAENFEDYTSASNLRSASTHWMRHTSATDQANAENANLVAVSKNLRHANLTTTSIYLHADRESRHKQTQTHQLWKKSE